MEDHQYHETIEQHVRAFESGDKVRWDDLTRFYQGKFFTKETGESESALLTTSVNLTFAITETALSSLIPPNPAVTALARSRTEEHRIRASEAFVNAALDGSRYRQEMGFFVFDSVVLGRGVTKTSWSAKKDMPVVRACDPYSVFFDLTTRRPEDIRYWIEATLLSPREYRSRVDSGYYDAAHAREAEPEAYPKWMLKDTQGNFDKEKLKNYQRWHLVYEVYDIEEDKVVHMLAGNEVPLMKDRLVYCPYDLLNLNYNGEDCRGLSEIALISPNQEEVNNLLTYWLNIVRACVPKGMFDPTGLDDAEFANAIKAGLATWSPVRSKNNKPLSENLAEFPMPKVPPEALELLDKVWNNITIVSALAEAQRGQVTGARTATELALIEGQLRNRLAARQRRIDEVTVSVAEKMLLLMQRYKKREEVLEMTGSEGWSSVSPDTLEGVRAAFKVVPYSPMESNRAVVQEQFKELLQFLGKHPEVDQRQLLKATIEIFDNPALRRYNIVREEAAPETPAPAPVQAAPPVPVDPAVQAAALGVLPSAAALPSPQMQAIADTQAQSPATMSPVIVPPGVPVGMPQPLV